MDGINLYNLPIFVVNLHRVYAFDYLSILVHVLCKIFEIRTRPRSGQLATRVDIAHIEPDQHELTDKGTNQGGKERGKKRKIEKEGMMLPKSR